MSGESRWNAAAYHDVSKPHVAWGSNVLDRLPLRGDECVIDAGCGTGKLTAMLLERLPRGRVIAIDRDPEMLARARVHLAGFRERVTYIEGDVVEVLTGLSANAVFSTATFHWVLDHARLFAAIARALRPGGHLVAQFGGRGNLERTRLRLLSRAKDPTFAADFVGFREPWLLASPAATKACLEAAGFLEATAWLEPSPTSFSTVEELRLFLETVVCHPYLARISDPARRAAFLEPIVAAAASDDPPRSLDYVRLNVTARTPQ